MTPIHYDTKRGFNLIEIAIVLAVIGLVIGGIYVAASAVSENNRLQTTQKQLFQIISNVRTTYASQAVFVPPDYAQIKTLSLFPADVTDDGTQYLSVYGGRIEFLSTAANSNQFSLLYFSLPQGPCMRIIMSLGTKPVLMNMGLVRIGNGDTIAIDPSTLADGVDNNTALAICSSTQPNNRLKLSFLLHG